MNKFNNERLVCANASLLTREPFDSLTLRSHLFLTIGLTDNASDKRESIAIRRVEEGMALDRMSDTHSYVSRWLVSLQCRRRSRSSTPPLSVHSPMLNATHLLPLSQPSSRLASVSRTTYTHTHTSN